MEGLRRTELFVREGGAREHPNKISSMLFYLAAIIIHGKSAHRLLL
jgi:hypothetical protein